MCHGRVATIVGTEGNDRIHGTSHDDVIAGLDGDDVIFGAGGDDLICGGLGNDYVRAGGGNDTIYGDGGDEEHLHGEAGADVVHAGSNSMYDLLVGGRGPDKLYGCGRLCTSAPGGGNDLVSHSAVDFFGSNYGVHVDLAKGIATGRGLGHDRLVHVEGVFGTEWSDTIYGDRHDNELVGGPSNDHIYGRRGNDIIDGDTDSDTLNGGRGKDLIEDEGESSDRPYSPDKAHGGPGDDTFEVGPGANTLHGGSGVDTVEPGTNLNNETVDLAAGTMAFEGYPKHSTIKGMENVVGSSHPDVIRGDGGPNLLIGSGNVDRLFGRGGDDTLDSGDQYVQPQPGDYADGGTGTDSCRAHATVHCEKPYTPPPPPPPGSAGAAYSESSGVAAFSFKNFTARSQAVFACSASYVPSRFSSLWKACPAG
jgi:Ca2+-binding RTX toxin-like protein